MTPIEGNKLIAEFMGLECDIMDGKLILRAKGKRYWYGKLYDEDWNSLMPVVEKIESIHDEHHGFFGVHISSNSCSIQGTNLWKAIEPDSTYAPVYMSDPNAVLNSKIESTWYNVIEFITWYNQQNT